MPVTNLGPYSPHVPLSADYVGRLVTANSDTAGGFYFVYCFNPTGSASVDVDIVVEDKFEVIDVIVRKDGAGAGNTIQIKNGATAISDAIVAATDKAKTTAGTLDAAQTVVAAGGTLRCSATRSAGTVNALVSVIGIIRP